MQFKGRNYFGFQFHRVQETERESARARKGARDKITTRTHTPETYFLSWALPPKVSRVSQNSATP
jgi:hypothetical protein